MAHEPHFPEAWAGEEASCTCANECIRCGKRDGPRDDDNRHVTQVKGMLAHSLNPKLDAGTSEGVRLLSDLLGKEQQSHITAMWRSVSTTGHVCVQQKRVMRADVGGCQEGAAATPSVPHNATPSAVGPWTPAGLRSGRGQGAQSMPVPLRTA